MENLISIYDRIWSSPSHFNPKPFLELVSDQFSSDQGNNDTRHDTGWFPQSLLAKGLYLFETEGTAAVLKRALSKLKPST